MRRFLKELKRRKVYRVGAAYLVAAFVVLQLAELAAGAFGLPEWFEPMVWVVCGLGFPLALVLAWAFDLTPEGVERTRSADDSERSSSSLFPGAVAGLAVLLLATGAGGWYLVAGGGEAEPRAGERSIAVLPFEDLGREEPGTFAEGMHDALLTRLSNISDLKVISRTSVQQYRDTDKTTSEIARELGVKWVLEGGVQEMGNGIQVNAQLIDPRTDTHAWAESYRRDLTAADLFDLQSEITKRIAVALEARLTASEERRVDRRPTENLEAYRLYVQGRRLLDQRIEEEIHRAVDHFRRAIDRDSAYAPAWAGLADARTVLWWYGFVEEDSIVTRARDAAHRALELDPDLGEAHASMGALHVYDRNGPAMLREFERAVELKPSYAQARHWLGFFRMVLGRLEEGLPEIRRAAELDPLSPVNQADLALSYILSDSLEKGLGQARRAEELRSDFPFGIYVLGMALSELGRQPAAISAFRRALRLNPSPTTLPRVRSRLAVSHVRSGDTARARELLSDLTGEGRDPFYAAVVRAHLGRTDEALQDLRPLDFAYHQALMFRHDPVFDPLRSHARYDELVRALNQAWGLNPDGRLPDRVGVSFGAGPEG